MYGLIDSQFTGNEEHFYKTQPVSQQFEHKLPEVFDQGTKPICVACSVHTFLNWEYNKDFNLMELFKGSGGNELGTSILNMTNYLKEQKLINYAALVHDEQSLKTAIFINGPCVGALIVRDSNSSQFWNGDGFEGGHAISLVGWDKDGFIIRNSWGRNWGNYGYTVIPYKDFKCFKEIWTLIKI